MGVVSKSGRGFNFFARVYINRTPLIAILDPPLNRYHTLRFACSTLFACCGHKNWPFNWQSMKRTHQNLTQHNFSAEHYYTKVLLVLILAKVSIFPWWQPGTMGCSLLTDLHCPGHPELPCMLPSLQDMLVQVSVHSRDWFLARRRHTNPRLFHSIEFQRDMAHNLFER